MVQDIVYSSVVAQEVDNGKAIITFLLIFHHYVADDFFIEVALEKKCYDLKYFTFLGLGCFYACFRMLSFMSVMFLITWTPYMPMNPSATILHHLDAEIPLDDGIWSDDN